MKHGPSRCSRGHPGRRRGHGLARAGEACLRHAGGPRARRPRVAVGTQGNVGLRRARRGGPAGAADRLMSSRSSRSSRCSCWPTGSRACAGSTWTSRATSRRPSRSSSRGAAPRPPLRKRNPPWSFVASADERARSGFMATAPSMSMSPDGFIAGPNDGRASVWCHVGMQWCYPHRGDSPATMSHRPRRRRGDGGADGDRRGRRRPADPSSCRVAGGGDHHDGVPIFVYTRCLRPGGAVAAG